MLSRQLEPELMDDPQEAIAYDEMDHNEVNQKFVHELLATGPVGPDILDLGTGTARIPIELLKQIRDCRVLASDGAVSMLEVARYNVSMAGLDDSIQLHHGDAKNLLFASDMFDTVISNSLIHHIPEPSSVIAEMVRVAKSGARIFVRDLCRPDSVSQIQHLVDTYANDAPPLAREMFHNSLYAALSLDEIREMVAVHGFSPNDVAMTSDRHWTWSSKK